MSSKENKKEDLTGRSRLVWNVLTSWGAYLVFVVAGFLMPRLIDYHVGQISLGLWDFCWSIVSYLELSSLGVGSSASRYVAKHRSNGDVESLRSVISTVVAIQAVIALFVSCVTVVLVWKLPVLFSESIHEEVLTTRWVIGLLGASVAVQMAFDSSRGVMTGCHRWDLYNGIHAVSRVVTVVAMVASLLAGGGLRGLAVVHLVVVIITVIVRSMYAARVCPELQIRPKYFNIGQAKKMLVYGGKVMVAALPQIVLLQTAAIIVVSSLGPAALAVFARHVALVRHVDVFVNKFSFILTPTAGSLSKEEDRSELIKILLESTRYGVAMTLPMTLFLVVMGDLVIELWMGPHYANATVMVILALGFILPVSQSVVMRILIGANEHGPIAFIILAVVLSSLTIGAATIHFVVGWSLLAVALLIAIPFTIANGIVVPIYGCKRFGIPIRHYVAKVFTTPVACAVIYTASLMIARNILSGEVLSTLLISGFSSTSLLLVLYWFLLLDVNTKEKIVFKVRSKFGSLS